MKFCRNLGGEILIRLIIETGEYLPGQATNYSLFLTT